MLKLECRVRDILRELQISLVIAWYVFGRIHVCVFLLDNKNTLGFVCRTFTSILLWKFERAIRFVLEKKQVWWPAQRAVNYDEKRNEKCSGQWFWLF